MLTSNKEFATTSGTKTASLFLKQKCIPAYHTDNER